MTPKALAALHRLCFTSPRPWNASEFVDLLASPSVFLIGKPDGFAVGRIAGPEVELLTLAVHPDARRRGIGAALLGKFEDLAIKRGAELAILEVSEDNSAAISIYRAHGYINAGYRKDYYANHGGLKVGAIVMTRDLRAT